MDTTFPKYSDLCCIRYRASTFKGVAETASALDAPNSDAAVNKIGSTILMHYPAAIVRFAASTMRAVLGNCFISSRYKGVCTSQPLTRATGASRS